MKTPYSCCSILAIFIFLSGFTCSRKTIPPSVPVIKADAYAPVAPLLKGLPANAYLRIAVQVFSGNAVQDYRNIQCSINQAGLANIKQLNVYYCGENFSATNLVGSIIPSSASFNLPVTMSLSPGMHYIWISAVLKDEVALLDKIELHAEKLIDASSKTLTINQGSSNYVKRIGVAVRKAGDNNVNTYRIPGITTTDKGTLIAVYDIRYAGSGDLPGNIDVGMSRSADGGLTWEPMKVIMDMGAPHENNGVGDPAILFDPVTHTIWVAALWSKGNRSIAGSGPGLTPEETGQLVLVSSSDDGLSWSAPSSITPQVKQPSWNIFFNGPGSGIAMQNGQLVFAAQYWNEAKVPYSTLIYSDDQGASWKGKIAGPKSNTTESQLVETNSGTLMLNMRDNRGGFRSVATTSNMGTSWTEHPSSFNALPDPVCMGSLIKAPVMLGAVQKEVLFFSNPNSSSVRNNITVKASLDLGMTWLPANQLLIDERTCYGYSSLVRVDAQHLGLLYEGVRDLYFVKLPVNEILK